MGIGVPKKNGFSLRSWRQHKAWAVSPRIVTSHKS
jgi:hypothetical protein